MIESSASGRKGWELKGDFKVKRPEISELQSRFKISGSNCHLIPQASLLLDIMQYWESRRNNNFMPARADIDPISIPHLPYVFLVNVDYCPIDFTYRLLGTGIVSNSRYDYTGERLVNLPSQAPPSQVWNLYESVVINQSPQCLFVPLLNYPTLYIEIIALPLCENESNINILFGGISFNLIERPYA